MRRNFKLILAFILIFTILSFTNAYYVKPTIVKKVKSDNNQIIFESKEEKYISPINEFRQKYNNQDIIAQLKIPDLDLDEVITKTTDNKYYLTYDLYKNYSIYGNPYVDYRNENNLSNERQINIYGHNIEESWVKDKVQFSKLEKLLDKDIFDSEIDIYLLTEEREIKYELYAIKIVTDDKEHMILDKNSDIEWQQHLDLLLQDTISCKENCKLNSESEILILQTCYFSPKNSYLIIIGKKIK